MSWHIPKILLQWHLLAFDFLVSIHLEVDPHWPPTLGTHPDHYLHIELGDLQVRWWFPFWSNAPISLPSIESPFFFLGAIW